MSWWQVVFLAGAGVLSGILGSVGGLASLASYPALLVAGLSPTSANVTNTVALVAGTIGSVGGSRPELTGQGRYLRRLCAASVAGGIAGAALLLTTPAEVFARIVPGLIAGACVLLILGPRLQRTARRERHHAGVGTNIAVFLVSVYSGYFGAAAGVLMLAILTAISQQSFARVNAAKSVISGAANAVAAVVFAAVGPVHWVAALALAAGSLLGGWLGPAAVRRLPATPLRIAIAVAGLCLAVKLAL